MPDTVQPRLLRGLRDYFPPQMHARQWIIDRVRAVYERYGYVPLGTPAMEYLDVLRGTAGEESEKQLFEVRGPDNERLGLRFDQTVALARVVAMYPDLPRPFRRYQVAPVWRCDNPYEKRGRFREFIQFDIDAVGVETAAADLEMITAMCDVMDALLEHRVPCSPDGVPRSPDGVACSPDGVPRSRGTPREHAEGVACSRGTPREHAEGAPIEEVPVAGVPMEGVPCSRGTPLAHAASPAYRVRVSSRRILNLLMPFAGVDERLAPDVFRVLDKRDKVGPDKVRLELTTGYKDESGSPVPGLGLANDQVDRIDAFLAIGASPGPDAPHAARREDVLAQVANLFRDIPGVEAELEPLARMSAQLRTLGYGDDRVVYDVSIARGLAYYTGTVFETELLELPEFGSVCSGGRYDDLVTRFLGQRVPAVGTSVGIDRMLVALTELEALSPAAGRLPQPKATAQVLVTVFDPQLMDDYLAMTYELRRAGINTELYLGTEKRIGKQVRYGDQYDIPILVVCGGDERARGEVQLKDMSVGRQRTAQVADRTQWRSERPGQFNVPRAKLVEAVRGLLEQIERL